MQPLIARYLDDASIEEIAMLAFALVAHENRLKVLWPTPDQSPTNRAQSIAQLDGEPIKERILGVEPASYASDYRDTFQREDYNRAFRSDSHEPREAHAIPRLAFTSDGRKLRFRDVTLSR